MKYKKINYPVFVLGRLAFILLWIVGILLFIPAFVLYVPIGIICYIFIPKFDWIDSLDAIVNWWQDKLEYFEFLGT